MLVSVRLMFELDVTGWPAGVTAPVKSADTLPDCCLKTLTTTARIGLEPGQTETPIDPLAGLIGSGTFSPSTLMLATTGRVMGAILFQLEEPSIPPPLSQSVCETFSPDAKATDGTSKPESKVTAATNNENTLALILFMPTSFVVTTSSYSNSGRLGLGIVRRVCYALVIILVFRLF